MNDECINDGVFDLGTDNIDPFEGKDDPHAAAEACSSSKEGNCAPMKKKKMKLQQHLPPPKKRQKDDFFFFFKKERLFVTLLSPGICPVDGTTKISSFEE